MSRDGLLTRMFMMREIRALDQRLEEALRLRKGKGEMNAIEAAEYTQQAHDAELQMLRALVRYLLSLRTLVVHAPENPQREMLGEPKADQQYRLRFRSVLLGDDLKSLEISDHLADYLHALWLPDEVV